MHFSFTAVLKNAEVHTEICYFMLTILVNIGSIFMCFDLEELIVCATNSAYRNDFKAEFLTTL